ncbi:hypothetical protein IMG5_196330 [Ichthyophthirius multifiliis]|uniref:Uncharacterized protein n=1 Tax=Ichthyophthirius multifiliis TaxID=5932 RepID=G0R548_ICHMU|nr:hypothetical protein IMG5_196330 [Ichthyophthirius multifiliis]EGR27450.1 hypothetical protein IMG5_196330 [Ichthyophthirius multifiliis]|eukprot:XP_004024360.1 hypothetical protein IMG5_196330 [Ichthyophthirius multifiliis]
MDWFIMRAFLVYNLKHVNYFFIFWSDLNYQDFRYIKFPQKIMNKIAYQIFWLFGLHILSTLMIFFVVQLQVFLDLLLKSYQMNNFCHFRTIKSKKIIYIELWKYLRHPNYFRYMLVQSRSFIPYLSAGEELYWTFYEAVIVLVVMNLYTLLWKAQLNQIDEDVNIFGLCDGYMI